MSTIDVDHIDLLADQIFVLTKDGEFDNEDGYDMGCAFFQIGLAILMDLIPADKVREILDRVSANIEWSDRDGKYDA